MDNFFEILIYLIVIISIVSSFLKKKEQPRQNSEQRTQPSGSKQTDTSISEKQPKEEYDILKEIEGFFNVGPDKNEADAPLPVKEEPKKKMTTIEEQLKNDSWHTPTKSEHEFSDDWERKKEELKKKIERVDSDIEIQAAKLEESLQKKEVIQNELSILIKSKFNNPAALKEYIIFSEILGKPKALRR